MQNSRKSRFRRKKFGQNEFPFNGKAVLSGLAKK